MGITIERNNLVDFEPLGQSIMTDLLANGFAEVGGETSFTSSTVATFETTATTDPLHATQPWRIRIECSNGNNNGFLDVHIGTETNLPDDRTVADEGTIDPQLASHSAGRLEGLVFSEIPDINKNRRFLPAHQFFRNPVEIPATGGILPTVNSRPMSYRLSISNRGLALCVWSEGYEAEGDMFAWLVVQRPVNNLTGTVLTDGLAPVFCIYSPNGGYPSETTNPDPNDASIYYTVVREKDVLRPYGRFPAGAHTEDSHAILNPVQQVAIAEGNQFVTTSPRFLATSRHLYTEDMDMLWYTSADVVSQFSEVEATVYGESTARKYVALNANGFKNTNMRILFLSENGGL